MRNSSYVRSGCYIFDSANPGDVWLCGRYNKSSVCFVYADENNIIRSTQTGKAINYLYEYPTAKCIKLGIKYENFEDYFNKFNFEDGNHYITEYKFSKNSEMFERNGEKLRLYDYVIAYTPMSTYYDKDIAIVIASNKCLFFDGSVKKINLCHKASESEINYYSKKCEKLNLLCQSLMTQGLKKNIDNTYNVGDLYKKGENIYLYLGDCKILSSFEPYVNKYKLRYTFNFNLPIEYNNGGPLWLKTKLSENYHINKIVMDFLNGKEQDINYNSRSIFIIIALSILGLKLESKVGYVDIVRYDCFKYNVKPSVLGGFIGNINIPDDFYDNNSFYFRNKNSGSDILQNAKYNLKVSIVKNKKDNGD